MATGLSSAAADDALDAIAAGWTYVQMHTGDPGAAGTSNVATETTRDQASFAAASSNVLTTNAALNWTTVAATETWTHFTVWSAATDGTFGWSGTVTNGSVVIGADVEIPAGDLDASFVLAS